MMVQPLRDAIHAARNAAETGRKSSISHLRGRKLTQAGVAGAWQRIRTDSGAGRYEGIDERVIQTEVDEEWSIGDYVLSGGELPAMTPDRCGFASGPGVWEIRRVPSRTPSRMACWIIPTILGRRCWMD